MGSTTNIHLAVRGCSHSRPVASQISSMTQCRSQSLKLHADRPHHVSSNVSRRPTSPFDLIAAVHSDGNVDAYTHSMTSCGCECGEAMHRVGRRGRNRGTNHSPSAEQWSSLYRSGHTCLHGRSLSFLVSSSIHQPWRHPRTRQASD